jgi:hypothetical protein
MNIDLSKVSTNIKMIFINLVSFYWMLVLYLLHNELFIFSGALYDRYISVIIYFSIGLLISKYCLSNILQETKSKKPVNLIIQKINPAYTEYMPIYLAISVIAFELDKYDNWNNNFSVVIIAIFIFLLFKISNIAYLNPAWYLFGYRVYRIEKDKANYIVIMNKNENYKSISNIEDLYKIDEYTFIQRKEI